MACNNYDLAWCAGFFEGEGNVNIYKNMSGEKRINPHYGLQIEVGNTNPNPLNKLQSIFGGSIMERKDKSIDLHHARFFRWFLSGNRAAEFLKSIIPFLNFKTEQAELGILLQKNINANILRGRGVLLEAETLAYRESLRLQLKELTCTGKSRRLNSKIIIPKYKSKNQLNLMEVKV